MNKIRINKIYFFKVRRVSRQRPSVAGVAAGVTVRYGGGIVRAAAVRAG